MALRVLLLLCVFCFMCWSRLKLQRGPAILILLHVNDAAVYCFTAETVAERTGPWLASWFLACNAPVNCDDGDRIACPQPCNLCCCCRDADANQSKRQKNIWCRFQCCFIGSVLSSYSCVCYNVLYNHHARI